MSLVNYLFDGTDGAVATTGNTGGYAIQTGTGSTQTLLSAAAMQGATGLRFVSTGAVSSIRFTANTASQLAISVLFRTPATPASTVTFLQVNDTTATRIIQLQISSGGNIRANDLAGVTTTFLTAAQSPAGTVQRIELVITNLSTTAGAFTVRAYNTSNTQVGSTINTTTANTGTNTMSSVTLGDAAAGPSTTLDLDVLRINDGSTTEIGPYTVNTTPPTVTAGANQTIANPGSAVNLTCTATPAAGSAVASYAWSLVSAIDTAGAAITGVTIAGATSQNTTFTPSVRGRYIFQITATDTEGNVSTPVTTRIFVPGTVITPIEVTSTSGWTTSTVGNVNDSSDATYIESGAPGGNEIIVMRLAPLQASTTAFNLVVRSLVQSTGGSQKVALLEGATVRKDWGAISPGTSFADQALTLTSGEMATIGSWNELDVRFTQV